MTRNPFINPGMALVYICSVALLLRSISRSVPDSPDSVGIPIVMLSLFVFSAAVMGYVFCFEPITLYLDGEKNEAGVLFLETLTFFAALTLLAFISVLFVF